MLLLLLLLLLTSCLGSGTDRSTMMTRLTPTAYPNDLFKTKCTTN